MICNGKQKVEIAHKEKFKDYNRWVTQYFKGHAITGELLPAFGTANLVMTTSGRNILPVYNFRQGSHRLAWQISGEQLRKDSLIKNDGCTACPIHCGRRIRRPKGGMGEEGAPIKGPEYETLGLMGSNIGVFDLPTVLRYNEAVDELGMDAISIGGTLAWAMEANEKGLWKNGLSFGDIDAVDKAVEDIAYRRGIGDELAEGSLRLSQKYGGEDFAIQVKEWNWRLTIRVAATDKVSNTPPPTEAAVTSMARLCFSRRQDRSRSIRFPLKPNPNWLLSSKTCSPRSTPMIICTFSAYAVLPSIAGSMNPQGSLYKSVAWTMKNSSPILRLVLKTKLFAPILWYERYLGYVTGEKYSLGRFTETGERNFNMERLFNTREGFSVKDDTLPRRLLDEPSFPGQKSGVPLNDMLPAYYKIRGWNTNGIATDKTLDRLQIRR